MITISTSISDFTEKPKNAENQLPEFAEPSVDVINRILNFSRNLDVKKSALVKEIEYVKS